MIPPNTIEGYISASKGLGIGMFNMHASGTINMMKAGVNKANELFKENPSDIPLKIAISILTSIDQNMMNDELGIPGQVADEVKRLAINAKAAGCDGIVSSVHETRMIKGVCGEGFLVINPAMRFIEELKTDQRDQKRLGIPSSAIANGADMIVMGSSLIKGRLPAVKRAYAEIEEGLAQREEGIATIS